MTIVIAAGGTGGHLYPAVALAREFLRRDPTTKVLFVGTTRGLESKVLAHEGFDLALISAKPVMGKGLFGAMTGLCALPKSLWQCVRILCARGADLVIGIGGYTSPMALLAAAMLGVPRVILEPNANPGMANRAVGPFAQRVFLAFESAAGSFARSKVRVVGTPIRQAFLEGVQQSQERSGPFHVLIFGGSQGAKAMNTAVIEGLPELMTQLPTLTVTHQTGESDQARVAEAYRRAGIVAEVTPFLYDMPAALRQADLVVARAGAMTVAELTTCGKPAILIPLPTAIYDHQMRNAKVMEAAGAAVVLPQATLTGALLARTMVTILGDPERVRVMGTASMAMRNIDAAEVIVRECYALMEGHHDVNRSGGAAGV
ncbi:MAG: undecaprenyldiphospho-muramoylpentapeptide beta-N-acetylglucosaminyltransferase [Nitrospirota bacterium]|nr:undecaprenyldiphospho-muramoylpentapeptide beta-N-acetylglucosaminyltransferase [Nitrospirota bacterium]MDP2383158.1 undecaprenyldiphospho-muramoylpentapeptide beta-N-acetylglucosaminyltransferase [Nitrospirota bacterium]MDP3595536.1 undecaprenyldiphospho-muramoylpentapeptide beta-N-acetylglucosaminyltransferase [Nitrospirota bacterium]